MIEGRDLVVQQVGIGLVEIEPLLDDGLVVGMERDILFDPARPDLAPPRRQYRSRAPPGARARRPPVDPASS
jgi:hypothetical protein